jgi:hypothetical protein
VVSTQLTRRRLFLSQLWMERFDIDVRDGAKWQFADDLLVSDGLLLLNECDE